MRLYVDSWGRSSMIIKFFKRYSYQNYVNFSLSLPPFNTDYYMGHKGYKSLLVLRHLIEYTTFIFLLHWLFRAIPHAYLYNFFSLHPQTSVVEQLPWTLTRSLIYQLYLLLWWSIENLITHISLRGENYLAWSWAMALTLKSQGKLFSIDRNI